MAEERPLPTAPRLVRGWRLYGANWMAGRSVLVSRVAGAYDPANWVRIRDLMDRLLPAGPPAGYLDETPPTLAAALEALARLLLDWCGHPVAAIERTPAGAAHVGDAAVAMGSPDMTSAACVFAIRVIGRAMDLPAPTAQWIDGAAENLVQARQDGDHWLKSSRKYLVRAAEARDIPWRTFGPAGHVLLLGEGRFGRRYDASATWRTSVLATSIAGNKRSGNLTLRRAGLPAPFQIRVESAAEVEAALPRLGLPLVLKPTAQREMQGMRIVYRAEDIAAAFAHTAGFGQAVMAESYIPGNEYRVLVLEGEVAAVVMRLPATVTGDGRTTITGLVERINQDPRRGALERGYPLAPMRLDTLAERYLAECGRTRDDVPAAGEVVQVHPLPMMRFGGGGRVDVTDRIHPDNRAMALAAVAVFDMDIAGIDLRMPDITRSWREVGAGICEVNPQPNLGVHYGIGSPIDPAGMLIDRTYPPADRGRMRHVLLVGEGDLTAHAAAVAATLRRRFGWRVATATTAGIDLDGWTSGQTAANLPDAYGIVVEDREIEAAVYAATPEAVAATGIGTRRLDVALGLVGSQSSPWGMVAATVTAAGTQLRRLPEDPEAAGRRVAHFLQQAVEP